MLWTSESGCLLFIAMLEQILLLMMDAHGHEKKAFEQQLAIFQLLFLRTRNTPEVLKLVTATDLTY